MANQKQAMSCEVVAKRLGLSVKVIHAFVRSGELRAYDLRVKLGGRPKWRIDEDAVEDFLKSRLVYPVPEPVRARKRITPSNIKTFV